MKAIVMFMGLTALGMAQQVEIDVPDVKAMVDLQMKQIEPVLKMDMAAIMPKIEMELGAMSPKLSLDLAAMAPKIRMEMDALAPRINSAMAMAMQAKMRPERWGREYDRGTRALDRREYDEAVKLFTEASAGTERADGALYWKAYALGKLGRTAEATAALDQLAKSHPQSGWLNDAKVLRAELAQAAGRPVSPEEAADDEIKLMAINSLMQSDPERSVPLLEKLLQTKSSPRLRERALFVLSQSSSPKAREAVVRVAKGSLNPDLQLVALRNLGVVKSAENQQLLSEVYSSTNDAAVKKQILQGYMASGARERIVTLAKSEPNLALRKEAIRYLGAMGGANELAAMYAAEQSVDIRSEILNGMMAANSTAKILEIARTEKDQRLRERAINMLGASRSPETASALVEMYTSSPELETKKRILRALGMQRGAQPLIEIARKESNVELKRTAVEMLSMMKSKEATDFLMELLNK
jgi:HEAT repeat protein